MTKFDVYLILSQVYVVGGLTIEKKRGFLNFGAIFWLILMLISW